ncbi:MAG: hypothetical protein CL930_12600 [Deltaproteobacteria bacterium]|nr:hypothetical protein [Deltaproteobacteria bacterium]
MLGGSKRAWLAAAVCAFSAVFAADDDVRVGLWLLAALLIPLLRRYAVASLSIALLILYLRYSGHGDVHFPAIDWIRPRGMDLWPGLLQTMGMVIVFAFGRRALGRACFAARIAVILGAALAAGWWGFPQHFNLDRIGAENPDGMPMVVNGRIETRDWRREVLPSTPSESWSTMMDNELTLSGIAHGMQQQQYSSGGVLRATLWEVQRSLARVSMGLTVLASAASVLIVLVLPMSRRMGWLGWLAVHLIGVTLAFPPLVNIVLRMTGWLGRLPESSGHLGLAFASAAATLVVVYLANEASKEWSK